MLLLFYYHIDREVSKKQYVELCPPNTYLKSFVDPFRKQVRWLPVVVLEYIPSLLTSD